MNKCSQQKDNTAEDITNAAPNDPVDGRVWRRQSTTQPSNKPVSGPVLRATVKPVDRFRPDSTTAPAVEVLGPKPDITTNSDNCHDDKLCATETSKPQTITSPHIAQTALKKKRVREQWTVEDKNLFFDAVAVHGKDFEAIQKAIAQKHRKKGVDSVIKTKDQVRHLYYRTWTTVSKLLDNEVTGMASATSKATQELFAVLNYGELRKRLGGYVLKKKGVIKLNELVNFGCTSVRIKGKNYRIKTPTCKALKQINKDDSSKKSCYSEARRVKLPLRVTLELQPYSMRAWNQVHLLAHNPRTRFSIPVNCQLSYLIKYLGNKWKPLSGKMFQLANDADGGITNRCSDNKLQIKIPPELNIKSHVKVHQILLNKNHCIVTYTMLKSNSMSKSEDPGTEDAGTEDHGTEDVGVEDAGFNRVEIDALDISSEEEREEDKNENLGSIPGSEVCENITTSGDLQCEDNVVVRKDETSEEQTPFSENTPDQNTPCCDMDEIRTTEEQINCDLCSNPPCSCVCNQSSDTQCLLINFAENDAISENPPKMMSSGKTPTQAPDDCPTDPPTSSNTLEKEIMVRSNGDDCVEALNIETNASNNDADDVNNVFDAKTHHWNEENAAGVTIAHVYLMLGKPSTFKLCYDWIFKSVDEKVDQVKVSPNSALAALFQTAAIVKTKLTRKVNDSANEEPNKNGVAIKQAKMVDVGVQCTSADKFMMPPAVKKFHGRGSSKLSQSFAVPSIPYYNRKSTSGHFRSTNINEIYRSQMELGTTAQTSASSDIHRNHLFKQPTDGRHKFGTVRKMKKFSVVACSNKRVEFVPTIQSMQTTSSEKRSFPTTEIPHPVISTTENLQTNVPTTEIVQPNIPTTRVLLPNMPTTKTTQLNIPTTEMVQSKVTTETIQLSTLTTSTTQPSKPTTETRQLNIPTTITTHSKAPVTIPYTDLNTYNTQFTNLDSAISAGLIEPIQNTENMTVPLPAISPSIIHSCENEPMLPVTTCPVQLILPNVQQCEKLKANPSNTESPLGTTIPPIEVFSSNHFAPEPNILFMQSQQSYEASQQTSFQREMDQSPPPLSMPPLEGVSPDKSRSCSPFLVNRFGQDYPDMLNTPQRVVSSDEDSMDNMLFSPSKLKFGRPNSSLNDELEPQLHCLISENSMDLISKFQDLVEPHNTS